jgi:RNA polymerase sigma factor (sigma-70 family)
MGAVVSDMELIKGISQKDIDCFETLLYRYSKYCSKIALAIGKHLLSAQDVEEITADVFISVWYNAQNIKPIFENIKGYLAAVARNKTKTHLYNKKIDILPLNEDIVFEQDQLEDFIDEKEASESIKSAVISLEQPDKEIFIRRYFYFEKISDIAKELSMNKKTVETRLLRGKTKLKKIMTERGIVF